MRESYKLIDQKNNLNVGTFHVLGFENEQYQYGLEFNDNLRQLPAIFRLADTYNNYSPALIKDWVETRVYPPDRQNIEEILFAMGLESYDELAILKYRKGRSVDNFWIDFTGEHVDAPV